MSHFRKWLNSSAQRPEQGHWATLSEKRECVSHHSKAVYFFAWGSSTPKKPKKSNSNKIRTKNSRIWVFAFTQRYIFQQISLGENIYWWKKEGKSPLCHNEVISLYLFPPGFLFVWGGFGGLFVVWFLFCFVWGIFGFFCCWGFFWYLKCTEILGNSYCFII